jgi:hypothetical protein
MPFHKKLGGLISKAKQKLEEEKIRSSEKSARAKGFDSYADYNLQRMKVQEEERTKVKAKKRKEALDIERQKVSNTGKRFMFGGSNIPAKIQKGQKKFQSGVNTYNEIISMFAGPQQRPRTKPRRAKAKRKKTKRKRRSKNSKSGMGSFWEQYQ